MLTPGSVLRILREECNYREGDSILVGISGGADSVALLHLLHAAKIPVAAAHVNYGLRGEESDGDEEFVSQLCAQLDIPLYVRKTSKDALHKMDSNLQAAARKFRYTFFEEVSSQESLNWIALGHHEDDQLETLLLNFMRGAGLQGLRGIQYANNKIIRPFLNVPRTAIETYLEANNIGWRNDSTNNTSLYLRNRIRHDAIPALRSENSGGWKVTAGHLRNAHDLLDALVDPWIAFAVEESNEGTKIIKDELVTFQAPHLLLNWILHRHNFRRSFSFEEFLLLIKQQPGKQYTDRDVTLYVEREYFLLKKNEDKEPIRIFLRRGQEVSGWRCNEITVYDPKNYVGFEALIHCGNNDQLAVRTWKEGDKIQPFGFKGTRKVSDILTDMKIPSTEKDQYPVLIVNDEIAWIPGYRIAEKFKVTDLTQPALHIQWNR